MTLDVTFTTLSNGPDAIGRLADGRAVFVPFAIPGETARVEITEEKGHYARARLVELIAASPERVTPVCPHFGPCGGCHYQHLRYDAQLKWKRQVLIDQLTRIGEIESPNVLETLASPDPLYYRNHVQFSQTPDGRLGFAMLNSHTVLPISECHITRPEIMELFGRLDFGLLDLDRVGVRVDPDGELMLIFESESGAPPDVELELPISVVSLSRQGESFTLIGSDHLVQEVEGRAFRVSPGSFFQVNTQQAGALVRLVLEGLGFHERAPGQVLDLYCGVGLFSAFIAPHAAHVIGVESAPGAVRDAEVNLDPFDNVALYESPVEVALEHLLRDRASATPTTHVVLDPPRAGCDKAVTAALVALAAPRLVYVSCDPATLARDARRLILGGYRLSWARPLDMFPQTHHVETVAVFERQADGSTFALRPPETC
jgi:23S rRNA (uracil1939-C5)-methyltransferase